VFHPSPSDFLTVGLLVVLEGLLSADNAMVLAVLVLGLPAPERRNALRYGILGAFAFRFIAVVLAIFLLALGWVKLVGAAYLFYLAIQHFAQSGGAEARRTPPPARPMFGLSAFWATVVKVEFMDLIFAVDSILVAVAMSSKLWVVMAGGTLGIIMMRLVISQLLVVVERYPLLVDAAFVIIGWVAVKLVLEYLFWAGFIHLEVPTWFSLAMIVVIFLSAFLYARRAERGVRL
jgi:YkoY family integral membrane protein